MTEQQGPTPGPWVKDYNGTNGHIKSVTDERTGTPTVAVYNIFPSKFLRDAEQDANARLIVHACNAVQGMADRIGVDPVWLAWTLANDPGPAAVLLKCTGYIVTSEKDTTHATADEAE